MVTASDFFDNDDEDDSNDSGSHSAKGKTTDVDKSTGGLEDNPNWVNKLDFSSPYAIVVGDEDGEYDYHLGAGAPIDGADDWRRHKTNWNRRCTECNYSSGDNELLKSHLRQEHGITDIDLDEFKSQTEREFEKHVTVRFKLQTRWDWLTFKNAAEEQHDIDSLETVMREDPGRMKKLEETTHYKTVDKFDETPTCQICKQYSQYHHKYGSQDDDLILTMHLEKHKRINVCSSHTVEELAEHGFLK